jgi:hypothetical protein
VLSVAVGARFSLISQHSCKRIQRLNLRVTSVGMGRGELGVCLRWNFDRMRNMCKPLFMNQVALGDSFLIL